MNKNYNYLRRPLLIPEYGRHIQEMVDSLLEIENRDERTRQAKAVIAVMGNLNPMLRDNPEYTHKLWDHLFIMSDFKLDVDSPYARPTREDLAVKPEKLSYSQGGITHKHYGRNIVRVLNRLKFEDPSKVASQLADAALYMRNKSNEYNQEHPTGAMIVNDMKILTDGAINLSEEWFKKVDAEHKSAHPQQRQNSRRPQHQQHQQRQQKKNSNNNRKLRAKN
jgi:hypothetical protein